MATALPCKGHRKEKCATAKILFDKIVKNKRKHKNTNLQDNFFDMYH